jgi:NAD+ synthase
VAAGYQSSSLALDCSAEVARIGAWLKSAVGSKLRRKGVIVAMSGGVDSSVCAALAATALGPQKVFGLLLPDRESAAASGSLGAQVATQLGVSYITENIGPALEALDCYRWRDEAIREVVPEFASNWKSKIVIAPTPGGGLSYFKLVVQSPDGVIQEQRLPAKQYLQIVAATNYKQRMRKAIEYFHADRLGYAVIGTPNRLEYDQGFFVKGGDGLADVKPIAHLYKTQVYALAAHFGLPAAVRNARPTTDTYSLAQGQDEFYFGLPYEKMDIALWCHNHGVPVSEFATAVGLNEAAAIRVYRDIESKRTTTAYLHSAALLVDPIPQVIRLDTPQA